MTDANTVRVMLSAAFKPAYLELVPDFERASAHEVISLWVPSVQIMKRLRQGEIVDVVILSAPAIEDLIGRGVLLSGSRVDLATSGIGVAVRAGAARPDVSSGEALKAAVLTARSIVYSTGPSGLYLARLFERMGIAAALRSKVIQVQGEPAGAVVASGEAQIGFQQMSELLPISGIDIVGPLPADVQEITLFSAGVHAAAKAPETARALLRFFTAPAAAPVMAKWGLQPVSAQPAAR